MSTLKYTLTREFEAYIEDLETRAICALGVPSAILDCEGDPMYKDTLRHVYEGRYQSNSLHFPCPSTGDMITLSDCWDCPRSQRCDIYATMLDEEF